MDNKIVYLLFLIVFYFIIIVVLVLYSNFLNERDYEMKKMIIRAKSANYVENKYVSFILGKSTFAFCFMLMCPFFSIFFFYMLLFHDYEFIREFFYWFIFGLMTLGTLSAFSDYFLAMIIIVDKRMYIRCWKTLFKPVVIKIDGSQIYESVNTGRYSFYSTRYMASIRADSKSFIFLNIKNKEQLRDILKNSGTA